MESKRNFIERVGCIARATESAISLNQTQAAEVVRNMGGSIGGSY